MPRYEIVDAAAAPAPTNDPRGRRGHGRVRVALVRGRAVVVGAEAHSPLRLLRPRGHRGVPWLVTTTFGGGLVDGDRIALDLEVDDGAAALLTTQASTKVYRGASASRLRARVGAGALLAVINDPVSCFAGSRYAQDTEIVLGPGASLALLDVVSAGRVAAGERWAFDRYAGALVVRFPDDALRDRVVLDAAHGSIAARMGRYDALATLVLAGPALAAARDALAAGAPSASAPVLETITRRGDAAILRLAAASPELALARARHHLAALTALVGDPFAHKR